MLLPNPHRAVVDAAKVRDYLLSPEHPIGRFKAAPFAAAGYDRAGWQQPQADLQATAALDATALPPPHLDRSTRFSLSFRVPSGRSSPFGSSGWCGAARTTPGWSRLIRGRGNDLQ